MSLLNKLKAAPGQPNRGLVEDFMRAQKWIEHNQTADDWKLMHFPKTDKEMYALVDAIHRFEVSQRESGVQS